MDCICEHLGNNANIMKRYVFQLFLSYSVLYLIINKVHPWWGLDKWKNFSVWSLVVFNWSHQRKAYIDFERQNMPLFFSLMPNFYMADWILFKFSKRKKKKREQHPYFGSEAGHGKFHSEGIIFHKYASRKWQCGCNRIYPWTSIGSLLL